MRTQVHNVNMQVGAGIPPIVKVSQYDELRVIGFRLFDGARAYYPGEDDVVTITGTKPSGLGFTEECSVNGSVASVETTLAMTQESGHINAELRISDGSTNIGTANFTLYVEPAPHPAGTIDGTAQEVKSEITALVERAEAAAGSAAEDAAEAAASAVATMINTDTTLAISGRAADSKTVGDALALKADAATTYTKTQVDTLVATDTTLAVSGKAADAKKTGDEISALKADLATLADVTPIPDNSDLNDYVETGLYTIESGSYTILHYPAATVAASYLEVTALTTGYIAQKLTKGNGDVFIRRRYSNGNWNDWVQIARDISTPIGEMKNLSAYGDISTATGFLNAFNLAIADDSICGITIPKGQYNVGGTLNIARSNFVIDGNGSTLNMRDGNGATIADNCFVINNQNRITIRNFLINMRQNENSTQGTTFYFRDCNNVIVKNIDIFQIGCRGALIFNTDQTSETNGCTKIFFKNVRFRGIDRQNTTQPEWPCGIIGVNLKESGYENCVVSGMARFALEFKNYSKDCYMINNVIHGSSFEYQYETGIALGGDRPAEETILGENIVIVGNVIKNCKYPLYLGRTHNSVFNNNVIEGQVYLENVNSCVFSGNTISSNTKYNIPLINLKLGNSDIYFNGNLYNPLENAFTESTGTNTNVLITGFMDGQKIDILNPTSGTPTTA